MLLCVSDLVFVDQEQLVAILQCPKLSNTAMVVREVSTKNLKF